MKCQACGNLEIVTKIKDETLSYGGQSLTLHLMKGDFCSACGEGVWDEESYCRLLIVFLYGLLLSDYFDKIWK